MLNSEHAPASQFGDIGEQRWTVEFLCCAIAIAKRVIKANGIELGICFLDQPLDIVLIVSTMIIASIGKDEQGTFGVVCTPHLRETEIHSVQEGSPALWGSEHHAALQVFNAVGEGAGEFGALIKADQEEFILGIGGLEELQRRFAG